VEICFDRHCIVPGSIGCLFPPFLLLLSPDDRLTFYYSGVNSFRELQTEVEKLAVAARTLVVKKRRDSMIIGSGMFENDETWSLGPEMNQRSGCMVTKLGTEKANISNPGRNTKV